MNMFFDTADPAPVPNGDWAYRKYRLGYPERAGPPQSFEHAGSSGCIGDEAECTRWVRERLNELYND